MRTRVLLLLVGLSAVPYPGAGQDVRERPRPVAPLFLEPGHWTYDAIRRLNGLGLAPPASDPALAPVTLRHAAAVFAHSEAAALAQARPAYAALAAAYRAQLDAEADTVIAPLAGSALRLGWAAAHGEALGGDGYFWREDWQGAQPVPAAGGPVALWRGHGHMQRWLAWSAEAGWVADEAVFRSAVASMTLGPLDVWGGRRRLQYGMGRGGAVVLGGALNDVPLHYHRTGYVFEGIGIHTRDPFHFPWVLRVLGADRAEATLGRISRNGRVDRPWVAFGRLIGTPFSPRFTLGINRGTIFGGDGQTLTAGRR
jgi:hypothetical protein